MQHPTNPPLVPMPLKPPSKECQMWQVQLDRYDVPIENYATSVTKHWKAPSYICHMRDPADGLLFLIDRPITEDVLVERLGRVPMGGNVVKVTPLMVMTSTLVHIITHDVKSLRAENASLRDALCEAGVGVAPPAARTAPEAPASGGGPAKRKRDGAC